VKELSPPLSSPPRDRSRSPVRGSSRSVPTCPTSGGPASFRASRDRPWARRSASICD